MTEIRATEPAGTRRLWMVTMPGLTAQVFLAACRRCNASAKHMDGRTIYPAKLGDVPPETWTCLRVECAKALGLPPSWEENRIDRYYLEWVKKARPLWGISRRKKADGG